MPAVLFVCLGNICRSPAAEGALRALRPDWEIDSAGTGAWHVGEPPYAPMRQAAQARGLDLSTQRARQIKPEDATRFDAIFALDASVLRDCRSVWGQSAPLKLLCADGRDVPDPYYTRDFDGCLDLIEQEIAQIIRDLD